MSIIYKYNNHGDLINYNTSLIELQFDSELYINQSHSYYNVFDNMKQLKKILYNDLPNYKDTVIIYHSKQ